MAKNRHPLSPFLKEGMGSVPRRKDEEDMTNEIIFLVEESEEGGYIARALGHSIYTEADTFEELKQEVADAVRCHFEEPNMPRIVRFHMVKEEVITL